MKAESANASTFVLRHGLLADGSLSIACLRQRSLAICFDRPRLQPGSLHRHAWRVSAGELKIS